jgi:hypothetical protein
MAADISIQRATILMRTAHNWDELADSTSRCDDLVLRAPGLEDRRSGLGH